MLRDDPSLRSAAAAEWQTLLGRFGTVGLERIAGLATDDRIDTKYLLREDVALEVVEALIGPYRVLDIDGRRFTTYRTQYFDTASYALFRRHHAGVTNRYKVRSRTYMNTGLSFVEVKRRSRRGVTSKVRQPTERFETALLPASQAFIDKHCSVGADHLAPAQLNSFDRICLVNVEGPERLTLDLGIRFETDSGPVQLPGIAVAELKQQRNGHNLRHAHFLRQMRAMNTRPASFSKYCMGLLLTQSEIKHNLFKPQLKRLERLMEEQNVVC